MKPLTNKKRSSAASAGKSRAARARTAAKPSKGGEGLQAGGAHAMTANAEGINPSKAGGPS